MDTPSPEPTGNAALAAPASTDLDIGQAAEAFTNLDNPQPAKTEEEQLAEQAAALLEAEGEGTKDESGTQEGEKITVEVDGKMIELTPEQVAEAYKGGLRQSDYSRKTAEIAEERKAAEAKISTERQEMAVKLNNATSLLEAQLGEQSKINWTALLESNPVEYLKQQHLYQERQAALQGARQEQERLGAVHQAEQQKAADERLASEHALLLEKIPAWKDPVKAKAEKAEIATYMQEFGYTEQELSQMSDHRAMLIVRKAMQMDKLLKQAPNATKRVEKTPVKVEKPGVSDKGERKAFRKTGSFSVEEAGAALNSLFS